MKDQCRRCGADWAHEVSIGGARHTLLCWPCRENWATMHDGNDELLEIDAQISYIEIEAQALLALCRGGVDTRESLRAVVRERLAVQDKLRDIISTWLNGYEKPVVVEQQERTNDR